MLTLENLFIFQLLIGGLSLAHFLGYSYIDVPRWKKLEEEVEKLKKKL